MHPTTRALAVVAFVLCGCSTAPDASIAKPDPVTLTVAPKAGVDYVALIGDSFVSGSGEGGYGPEGWPALVRNRIQARGLTLSIRMNAPEQSGWVPSGRPYSRVFIDQVISAAGVNDRLVILFGGRDVDAAVPLVQLSEAVQRTLNKVREKAPQTTILVIGPVWTQWVHDNPSPAVMAVRDTVKTQAETANALFLDPIAEQWFSDRPELIGDDGLNPTNDGHAYLAERLLPPIINLLRPAVP